jgi:hypothetical protein
VSRFAVGSGVVFGQAAFHRLTPSRRRRLHILQPLPTSDAGAYGWALNELLLQFDQQLAYGCGAVAVEIAGRLVGQQQLGLADQRPGHAHPLTFAAGQFRRPMIQSVAQSDSVQQRSGTLDLGRTRTAVGDGGDQHVFQRRQLGQ